ncbi:MULTISPECIES: response regulator [Pseudomonas aeruginosa group]|uniref:response regulator n=1 Tax=Pseudomonas aeruginosa group TaxID=136841 RepID=UPI00071BC2C3|nr:response regulator [Pseudomonas aeruginosa]KSR49110.1 hypothetical protein APB45_02395 [Pseudomonas aeruginosa]RPV12689.1 hypothetical protein IPC878_11050 [Pseudomonas aeruginosa]
MSNGRLIYIDEDMDDIEQFQEFIDEKFDLSVLKIENDDDIDSIAEEIISSNPDAIITDYLLNEKARVKFDGQALIEAIQSRNKHLPCFLLTSHAPDALNATHDVRLVLSKSIPFGGDDSKDLQSIFLTQIEKLMHNFRKNLQDAVLELDALAGKPTDKLTAIERQRAIELDNFIESHGLSSHPIPDELKDDKNLELLTQLLQDIDKLIEGKK